MLMAAARQLTGVGRTRDPLRVTGLRHTPETQQQRKNRKTRKTTPTHLSSPPE
jgi:hypothetical protein